MSRETRRVAVAPPAPLLEARDVAAWRRWLAAHHATERAVWLVFFKGAGRERGVSYDDALDEALCWGWIDSLVRRIDDEKYALRFTPRTNAAKWSAANVARLRRLLASKRVRAAGRAVISDDVLDEVRRGGERAKPAPRAVTVPEELTRALAEAPDARRFFASLAPSYRRYYAGWVAAAKRPETRQRRAEEAVRLLAKGMKTFLK